MPDLAAKQHSILQQTLKTLAVVYLEKKAPVTIQERPFRGIFILRALEDIETLNKALASALGINLSPTPNSVFQKKDIQIFWLRPDQWQITCPPEQAEALYIDLEQALSGLHTHIIDVSDGHTILRLQGERAEDVLRKGCPLDLYQNVFPVGSMARSRIVHADILLHRSDQISFDLYVRTSFAEYLLKWLIDAGLEYGVNIQQSETGEFS